MEENLLFNNMDEEQEKAKGPETCLGIQFANDEERRAFFREELRKKLPELRQIEGFPIGEDDDIINLSDPPYYTACPNPWINDFIKEWEADKARLQAEGKRKADFEVKEPYSSDVSEGKNNPIYMAHAYHTKVPHPAIMRYILHYTQPGDIVFDGFCGTGMTGVAANMCGSSAEIQTLNEQNVEAGVRHGICSDLSPAASSIAAGYNAPFRIKEFKRKALKILDILDAELGWMYETNIKGVTAKINSSVWSDVFICPSCNNEITLWDVAVNEAQKEIKSEFKCPYCGNSCSKKTMSKSWETNYDSVIKETITINKKVPVKYFYSVNGQRGEKTPDQYDFSILEKISDIKIAKPRTTKLQDGYNTSQPIQSNGITYTHLFHTYRSYVYFSRMYELIKDDIHLLNWFTSVLLSTSKMNRFRFSGTGINTGTLYVPSLNWEFTPSQTLRRKIETFCESGYVGRGNSLVGIMSATNIQSINERSIDYIFCDPPFGANLMYSELNVIWESWIGVKTNNTTEAIVNPSQHKNLFDYQNLMNRSLKEFYRVLKPGKWLTMEFSNTSAAVWNSIQNALQGVGFIVANVSALDKQQGSFKAVTTPTAVKQDLIISCFKPTSELTELFEKSNDQAANAWDFVEELLEHLPVHIKKDNSTTAVVERSPKILFDRLIAYYVQKGYPVSMDAADFQRGLKERFVERDGMYFTAEQAIEYEEKKKDTAGFDNLFILVGSEAEGIEWLKRKLAEGPKTYSEIQPDWMQDLVSPKKGDTLPELMQILDENFIKDENGYWSVPDVNNQAQLDAVRNKRLLKEFAVYVEEKKIKNARLEALRAGFKECYKNKDFATIVSVGDKIPEELLTTDEVLLQYYDIASSRV